MEVKPDAAVVLLRCESSWEAAVLASSCLAIRPDSCSARLRAAGRNATEAQRTETRFRQGAPERRRCVQRVPETSGRTKCRIDSHVWAVRMSADRRRSPTRRARIRRGSTCVSRLFARQPPAPAAGAGWPKPVRGTARRPPHRGRGGADFDCAAHSSLPGGIAGLCRRNRGDAGHGIYRQCRRPGRVRCCPSQSVHGGTPHAAPPCGSRRSSSQPDLLRWQRLLTYSACA